MLLHAVFIATRRAWSYCTFAVLTPRRIHDLSDSELLERLAACADDCVVECATCATDYRVAGLAIDMFSTPPRHFLCPLCRNDLVGVVRQHAETCRLLAAGS
jgi:hypothetical protein